MQWPWDSLLRGSYIITMHGLHLLEEEGSLQTYFTFLENGRHGAESNTRGGTDGL